MAQPFEPTYGLGCTICGRGINCKGTTSPGPACLPACTAANGYHRPCRPQNKSHVRRLLATLHDLLHRSRPHISMPLLQTTHHEGAQALDSPSSKSHQDHHLRLPHHILQPTTAPVHARCNPSSQADCGPLLFRSVLPCTSLPPAAPPFSGREYEVYTCSMPLNCPTSPCTTAVHWGPLSVCNAYLLHALELPHQALHHSGPLWHRHPLCVAGLDVGHRCQSLPHQRLSALEPLQAVCQHLTL